MAINFVTGVPYFEKIYVRKNLLKMKNVVMENYSKEFFAVLKVFVVRHFVLKHICMNMEPCMTSYPLPQFVGNLWTQKMICH